MSRQEIYAAAAAHDELGPEYSDAVVASFLEKVDEEIDARVDARFSGSASQRRQLNETPSHAPKGAAVGIGASGIAFFVVGGNADERLHRILWVLLLLVVICTAAAGWAGQHWKTAGRPSRRQAGRPSD